MNKFTNYSVDYEKNPGYIAFKTFFDTYMLESILIGLSDVQSRIFTMLLEGYSKTEICKELSISYTLLKAQLEKLQKVVSDYLSMQGGGRNG